MASPEQQVLIDAFDIPIIRNNLDTLRGGSKLNDQINNFYLLMIVERSRDHSNLPSVYALNTLFYLKLLKSGYETTLKRWTRKIDIFAHDIILVPV